MTIRITSTTNSYYASSRYATVHSFNAAMSEAPQPSDFSQPTPNKPGLFWNALRWLMRCGMWILLIAWLFSFFGQQFFVAELLSNFRVQFFAFFLTALLLTTIAKARWLLLTCMFLAMAWSGWEIVHLHLSAQQPPKGNTEVRVMSFNTLATNEDFASTIAEIREHDPDVVAIIEYANMWHIALDALNESHPYQHRDARWHGYGIAVFSKLPLESAEAIPLTKDEIDNPAAMVSFKVDGQTVRLMAVHVMSPTDRYRLKLRNQQFKEIADHLNADSSPVILVGDMNCTPSSRYLAGLIADAKLRDSRKGFGVQASWPSFAAPLAVPIDHVFVSETICIHDRFLGKAGGSDHWPVIVDVSVQPN